MEEALTVIWWLKGYPPQRHIHRDAEDTAIREKKKGELTSMPNTALCERLRHGSIFSFEAVALLRTTHVGSGVLIVSLAFRRSIETVAQRSEAAGGGPRTVYGKRRVAHRDTWEHSGNDAA